MKKTLFSNYIFNMLYSILNLLIPLITTPYISRVLEADGIGEFTYTQNIVTYFMLLAALGIPNYGVREIAKRSNDCEERSKVFWEIFVLQSISSFLASILYYYFIFHFGYFESNRLLFAVAGIVLLLNIFNIDWFYRGVEEFKYITIRGLLIKIISVVMIFLFVKQKDNLYLYALIMSLAVGVNNIVNIIHVRKYIKKIPGRLQIQRHIRMIIVLFTTAVAVQLYTLLDTTFVGYLCGIKYVGYYSNAMKMTRFIAVIITSLGTVLLPRISIQYHENRTEDLSRMISKALQYTLLVSIPCTVVLIFVSDEFVSIMFGMTFQPAGLTMKILSLLIPIVSIGDIVGTQLMMAIGQERKLMYTVIAGAVINIILNLYLIPRYQQNGAAVSAVITELIVMLSQFMVAVKYVRIKIPLKPSLNIIFQTLLTILFIYFIRSYECNIYLKFVLIGLGGFCAYFIFGFLLRNTLQLEIVRRVLKKNREEVLT